MKEAGSVKMTQTQSTANIDKTAAEAKLEKQAVEARGIGTEDKGSFRELVDRYERPDRKYDPKKSVYVVKNDPKIVLMNSPVNVFYNKTNNMGDPFEVVPLDNPPITGTDPEVYHGITLRQLLGVWANVKRRCEEEKWTDWQRNLLLPETVTLHDVRKYVVLPFTESNRQSFVATLPSTASYQVPRLHLSAPFTLPIKELVVCLQTFVHDFRTNCKEEHDRRGGGMTENTPIWLLAFARNEWARTPYDDDPMQTLMAKAIKVAGNRVLSVTDKDGKYFTRAWPAFESSLAIKHRLWYIYTALDGDDDGAVGLISGGATSDTYAMDTLNRERHFPTSLIVKCIKHNLKNIGAEHETDRIHILNAMIGTDDINSELPEADDKYDSINNTFRAHFTTPGTLQAALLLKNDSWQSMLQVMSKGDMSLMRFDFEEGRGWGEMTNDDAIALIRHLPHTIKDLTIVSGNFSSQFIRALADWVKISKVKTLFLEDTLLNNYVDNETIKYFAKALKHNTSLKSLQIWRVNQENEQKVWEEDVGIIEILAQDEKVADALFVPLDGLYAENNVNFARIAFLHTLFMRIDRTFFKHVTNEQSQATLDWAQCLSASTRTVLFQSEAGSFVKTILNRKFTWRQNLGVVMTDLYVQLAIVSLLCIPNGNNSTDKNKFVPPLLAICLSWIAIRELLQMGGTYAKPYIKEASNWIDITQIVLLCCVLRDYSDATFNNSKTLVQIYAIMVSWFALIFVLNNFWFPLATFVTGFFKIMIGLLPFLFTTLLLSMMFAHAFRAAHVDDECDEADGWNTCSTVSESYLKSISMFLTDGDWSFGVEDNAARGLAYAYGFIVGIVLLNIVIAVVSNIFTDVQNAANTAFWDNRFSITTETELLWSLLPCLKKYLRNNFFDTRTVRINFLDESSQNENIRNLEDPIHGNLDVFFNWWFSPTSWGAEIPNLWVRLQAFYGFSLWEDIIYPGIVLEKILLGVNYDVDLVKIGSVTTSPSTNATDVNSVPVTVEKKSSKGFPWFLLRFIVKIFLWFLFTVHIVIIFSVFICGLFSFGLLWPQGMKRSLFHISSEPDVNEIKELSNENGKLKEELRKDYYKLKRDMEEIKDQLKTKPTLH